MVDEPTTNTRQVVLVLNEETALELKEALSQIAHDDTAEMFGGPGPETRERFRLIVGEINEQVRQPTKRGPSNEQPGD